MEDYIAIGKIRNTHGIKGELTVESYSDFDDERYKKGNTIFIRYENAYIPMKIAAYRDYKNGVLISFAEHADINLVEKYKGCDLFIRKSDRHKLKKGEYYKDEIAGLTAVDEDGNRIGTVRAVEATFGAQNHLRIVREGGNDVLVPYVPTFIKNVDLKAGTITIHVVEGLL